jgi:Type IV conjugative transfer system lipoprotein (TraV)
MDNKKMILPLILITLSGCSTYSETFDCPPGSGVGCKSLSAVNQMMEEGRLPLLQAESTKEPNQAIITEAYGPQSLEQDNYLKIWIAGYEDEVGYYHEPTYIYAPLHKSSSLDKTEDGA